MTEYCLISIDVENGGIGYMHFNPDNKNYFIDEEIKGACVFTKQMALELVKYININNYKLKPVDMTKVKRKIIKRNSLEEKEVFDQIHLK